jgi:hypothetical protein
LLIVVNINTIAGKDKRSEKTLIEYAETRIGEIELHVVLETVKQHQNGGEETGIVLLFVIVRLVQDDE